MNKRTMDEMITYFNQEVNKMDISQKDKMKLLGMITAIGYENKKQELVRCGECKWWRNESDHTCGYWGGASPRKANGFCSDGERKDNG